jgi:hypothetical protein
VPFTSIDRGHLHLAIESLEEEFDAPTPTVWDARWVCNDTIFQPVAQYYLKMKNFTIFFPSSGKNLSRKRLFDAAAAAAGFK